MTATSQACASGPSWLESRRAFSPVTLTLLTMVPPPRAESTAGQPILYASAAETPAWEQDEKARAATTAVTARASRRMSPG